MQTIPLPFFNKISDLETEDEWISILQNPKAQSAIRQAAFDKLMKKYQKPIYAHIRKMVVDADDTDDLVQETFVKVWRHIEKFKREAKFYTWLYRIATNETLRFLERKRKKFGLPINDISEELMHKMESDSTISSDKVQLLLQKALLTLPDKQRLVFNMKYFEEMKYEDISEVVGTSVGALKASYHIAVKKIEDYLKINAEFIQ